MFDCSLFFYCHCHKSSPQNLLISEIQKAQKQEPFFPEAAALKTSGNLKELMILLSFLPRAIMKLFYKRAAAPIIQIIPFSCSAGAGKKRRNNLLCAQERGTAQEGSGGCAWRQGLAIGAGNPVMELHRIYSGLCYLMNPFPFLKMLSTNISQVYSNYLGIRKS